MKILAFLTCLIFSSLSFAQGTWTKEPYTTYVDRFGAFSFVIDGKAYVGGGRNISAHLASFYEYNPSSQKWTKKADYPGAGKIGGTGFAINGKGYVAFGGDQNNKGTIEVWVYDPIQNKWNPKADFSGTKRLSASGFVIGNSVYLGTGAKDFTSDFLTDYWKYTPATDTWVQIADFPGGTRNESTAFAIGSLGYVGSGTKTGTTYASDFWKYDESNNSWTKIADLPGIARTSAVNFVIDSKAYVGTGNNSFGRVNDFYKYDPIANKWDTIAALPTEIYKRNGATTFVINDVGYLGLGALENNVTGDLWTYKLNSSIGFEENMYGSNYVVYPNPAENEVFIQSSLIKQNEIAEIYNVTGQIILKQNILHNQTSLNFQNLTPGVYFLKITGTNSMGMRKIVKL